MNTFKFVSYVRDFFESILFFSAVITQFFLYFAIVYMFCSAIPARVKEAVGIVIR